MHLSVELLILVFSTLVSFVVGLFVFTKNPKSRVSQVYGILTLCLILYPIFNYASLQTVDRLVPIRLVMFFSSVSVYFQYALVRMLAGVLNRKANIRLFVFTLIVAALNLTPYVFTGLTGGSNPVPVPGVLSPLFIIHFLTCIYLTVFTLTNSLRKFSGNQKAQTQLLLLGMVPIFLLSPITSFIMPVLLENSSLIFLSPVYGAFFVCMVGYSIVKHKMFDIGLVVARSVGYLMSVIALSAFYLGGVYIVSSVILPSRQNTFVDVTVNITLLSVAVLSFGFIRQKFDKFTNRLFYRDAYEPQQLLDDLNKVLVGTIELEKLLKKSAEVIGTSIKSDYCVFLLAGAGKKKSRIIGTQRHELDGGGDEVIGKLMSATYDKVIIADELGERDERLTQVLKENNTAVLLRLTDKVSAGSDGMGYMLLGVKKSGGLYSSQDKRVLEIIADEMVIAIQNALRFEEIQQFNVTLQRKIDEATRDLRRANEKLKAMDETKDEFISMASHQLRTPLTSVKGYVSMVLEGDAGKLNPMQKKLLEQTFFSAQRMVYLIADLLNVSRLRTGKFLIEPKPTDLAELVSAEVTQLLPTAKARNLELTFKRPKNFPQVMLDETKTRQVIMNFIDNAIYYTHPGGHIAVELKETDEAIEFTVTDDGLGVPKAEQHRLFTKFYRANNAKKARPDGTGLGLFMAKKVVVAQGGAIIFKSQEGKGSTFGFTFAKAKLKVPSKSSAQSPSTVLAVK